MDSSADCISPRPNESPIDRLVRRGRRIEFWMNRLPCLGFHGAARLVRRLEQVEADECERAARAQETAA